MRNSSDSNDAAENPAGRQATIGCKRNARRPAKYCGAPRVALAPQALIEMRCYLARDIAEFARSLRRARALVRDRERAVAQ
jgi:hypothetical protein